MTAHYFLVNAVTGAILVPHLEVAATLWQRTVGLIGRSALASDAGLWLSPCNSIHTFGVRFPIDVLFLDAQGCVLHKSPDLRPFRIGWPVRKAKTVVELPAGALARIDIPLGMLLDIRSRKVI